MFKNTTEGVASVRQSSASRLVGIPPNAAHDLRSPDQPHRPGNATTLVGLPPPTPQAAHSTSNDDTAPVSASAVQSPKVPLHDETAVDEPQTAATDHSASDRHEQGESAETADVWESERNEPPPPPSFEPPTSEPIESPSLPVAARRRVSIEEWLAPLPSDLDDPMPASRPLDTVVTAVSPRPPRAPSKSTSRAAVSPPTISLSLTPASQIQIRPVRWLWAGRVPLGALTLLGGREGIGKTICADTLAADITRGRLDGIYNGIPRSVIVATTEDSWEHTIVPRLMAAGADLDRAFRVDVETVENAQQELVVPRDLPALKNLCQSTDVALILLDPLVSRLTATTDTWKDASVRQALEPLVSFADDVGVAVLGLIHVSKSDSTDPLTLLIGSRAFAAVARAVLFVTVDPENESQRLLGQAKNNLGRCDLPTLTFEIVDAKVGETPEGEVRTGKLVWGAPTERSIRDVVGAATESPENRTATLEAAQWLADYLSHPDTVKDSGVIKKGAYKAGHSNGALDRARKRLKVVSRSHGFPRRTTWELPLQTPQPRATGTTDTTDTTGDP